MMNHFLIILLSIFAGVVLAAISNWLYDLLRNAGVFPNKPRIKHVVVVMVVCLPLVLLVALPDLSSTSQTQLSEKATNADRVRECLQRHNLSASRIVATISDWHRTTFQFCEWPPPSYAEADGFSSITVERFQTTEDTTQLGRAAQIAPFADRIRSTCKRLKLSYTWAAQGLYDFYPPFEVDAGTVIHLHEKVRDKKYLYDANGQPLGSPNSLGFYPNREDVVILHLDMEGLDKAECAQ